jgi:hypothetical protein
VLHTHFLHGAIELPNSSDTFLFILIFTSCLLVRYLLFPAQVENRNALDGSGFQRLPHSGTVALPVGSHSGLRFDASATAAGRQHLQLAP